MSTNKSKQSNRAQRSCAPSISRSSLPRAATVEPHATLLAAAEPSETPKPFRLEALPDFVRHCLARGLISYPGTPSCVPYCLAKGLISYPERAQPKRRGKGPTGGNRDNGDRK